MDTHSESQEILPIGVTNYRNNKVTFGLKPEDRLRHIYIIGKTGVGKTTLMQNMITEDLRAGRGVCIIDPHNDFAERTLGLVPKNRINDTIYFDPADIEYPIAFNIMEAEDDVRKKSLIASSVVGTFKKIFADSWGPRLEYLLRNSVLALLDSPGNTMLGIPRILIDKSFRKKIVKRINDPVVKAFWEDEFTKYNQQFAVEAASPIQNKIGQFLSSEISRNIFSQPKSSIDLKDIMDNRKILICNFSKGKIGEDMSSFLGAMMITKIQIASMERAEIPEDDRIPFYLYVDEFQNFTSESFSNILSEARKFKLSLNIAHQYLAQLGEEVQAAVLGNVGSIISFRIGAEDADELSKEFAPVFGIDDLVQLRKAEIYLKLMIDGTASQPFSATTLPPNFEDEGDPEVADKVKRVSRERYATSRAEIQDKIKRWMGQTVDSDQASGDGQQPTKMNKQTKKVKKPASDVPAEISLNEAMKKEPVNFKGEKDRQVLHQPPVVSQVKQQEIKKKQPQNEIVQEVIDTIEKEQPQQPINDNVETDMDSFANDLRKDSQKKDGDFNFI